MVQYLRTYTPLVEVLEPKLGSSLLPVSLVSRELTSSCSLLGTLLVKTTHIYKIKNINKICAK